jgi:glycosyltransferase involved in cell wall biosynthesis
MYLSRYPELLPSDCVVIPNGYDEDDFTGISRTHELPPRPAKGRLRLVHAGLIYPDDRDPRAFFRAVQKLKAEGVIDSRDLTIDLRASGSEQYYQALLRGFGIADIVQLLPALPHREALEDTATADALLLFQAASCNHQIPAKVYEYLRLEKPILALISPAGDTAKLLQAAGGATIVDLADENSIAETLPRFITSVRCGTHSLPDPQKVQKYTRRRETAELARYLDELLCPRITQHDASDHQLVPETAVSGHVHSDLKTE